MKIDLNLFTVFDAIYTEGSLTRAAQRLNLTQPAISHALGRLRERLDDPLFERQGHKMRPTPLAQSILPDIQAALSQLNLAIQQAHVFDAQTSDKTFRLAMRDVIEATVLPPMIAELQQQAPNLQLASVAMNRKEMESDLASGELDFAVDILLPCPDTIRQKKLLDDELVVLSLEDVPLNADAYMQASHVLVSGRASGPSLVDYALNSLGLKRNIGVRCQHYFAACHMLSQLGDSKNNMLLTMPKRYAVSLCQRFTELHMHRFPFDSQNIDVYLYWHQSLNKDAANMWFRQFLNELIAKQGF